MSDLEIIDGRRWMTNKMKEKGTILWWLVTIAMHHLLNLVHDYSYTIIYLFIYLFIY
jgi:hypothetical protein